MITKYVQRKIAIYLCKIKNYQRYYATTLQRYYATTLQRYNATTLQRYNATTLLHLYY